MSIKTTSGRSRGINLSASSDVAGTDTMVSRSLVQIVRQLDAETPIVFNDGNVDWHDSNGPTILEPGTAKACAKRPRDCTTIFSNILACALWPKKEEIMPLYASVRRASFVFATSRPSLYLQVKICYAQRTAGAAAKSLQWRIGSAVLATAGAGRRCSRALPDQTPFPSLRKSRDQWPDGA